MLVKEKPALKGLIFTKRLN